MSALPLLILADLGDVLQGLMPIIFVVLYGVAHLVGNFQKANRKPAPRPRPAQPPQEFGGAPPVAGKAPAGGQPTLEETLRREVEEFLRKAQGQGPQQAKSQPQRPQSQPPSRQPARPPQQQRPQPPRQGRPNDRAPQQPEPSRRLGDLTRGEGDSQRSEPLRTDAPLTTIGTAPLGSGVARHVAEHLSPASIAQHAQSLGSDISAGERRMQAHMQQTFDHSLGVLAPQTSVQHHQQIGGSTAAQDLRVLLARPEGVRQIMIASEILRRPEERWSQDSNLASPRT